MIIDKRSPKFAAVGWETHYFKGNSLSNNYIVNVGTPTHKHLKICGMIVETLSYNMCLLNVIKVKPSLIANIRSKFFVNTVLYT